MNRFLKSLLLALVAAQVYPASLQAEEHAPLEAGFLAHEFSLTLESGRRGEYLGPLYYWQKSDGGTTWAFPPMISRWRDDLTDSSELDVLYPLFSLDQFGDEWRWHFFQVISLSSGGTVDGEDVQRFTVFPLYFQQRSEDPAKNYTAVVPFYGTIRNRMFREEYKFVMAPLFLRTRKRDMVTDNYLFPFFHLREGPGMSGWQLWPLYSQENRAVSVRTNLIEEPEVLGGYHKHFVLWPLFIKQVTGIGTENPNRELLMFPLYQEQRSTKRDMTALIPPLFGWMEDHEEKYREYRFPYPLVVWSVGEGETGWRVWPLYGEFRKPGAQTSFVLWPLYRDFHVYDTAFERDRSRVLFFLYSNIRERNRTTGDTRQGTYLWPLFAAERDLEGRERFQMLALLEPVLRMSKSVRRNLTPLWAIWRSERDPKAERSSQSFLWNLYRNDTNADSKKCSLLFGLIQYQSTPEGSRWRWFYLPSGKPRTSTSPAEKP